MSWNINLSASFKKQYQKKESLLKVKIDEALKKLTYSINPLDLGRKKRGNLHFYALDLTYSDRLAYDINSENNTIILLKVCSHKVVYGKD